MPPEFWIRPSAWREIFDNDPDVAVNAARTLKERGLLRVQDNANLQVVVVIRGKSAKALPSGHPSWLGSRTFTAFTVLPRISVRMG
jgi:hypothetical protein